MRNVDVAASMPLLSLAEHFGLNSRDMCVQTSCLICCAVHSRAGLPNITPGASQSEISTERIPLTVPSPYWDKSTLFQNCRCEMEVSAQGESR